MKEIGSEFDLLSIYSFISLNKNPFFKDILILLRSGRDAFKIIAKNYKDKIAYVLLPALCCESMVTPFRNQGYNIKFYKLNFDYTADIKDVELKISNNCIFIYMNYFGISQFSTEYLQKIKNTFSNVIFVEDITHDLLLNEPNQLPDFRICSIRKWIAIPDGGLLLSNSHKLENIIIKNDAFSKVRLEAMANKSLYLKTKSNHLKEVFRYQFSYANGILDADMNPALISDFSAKIFENCNFNKILEIRKRNFNYLYFELKKIQKIEFYNDLNINKSHLYFPIIVENRDKIQEILASHGIYCPVIWPIPNDALGICKIADYLSSHMLALPCDQRYSLIDLKKIVKVLKRALIIGDK